MVTASEEIAARRARYAQMQHAEDADGRSIGVQRLKPSEQIKLQEWTAGLDGTTTVVDDNPESKTYGKSFEVSKRMPVICAGSVREINGDKIPFPKNRGELDAIMDRLDSSGISAASEALAKFEPPKTSGEESVAEETQAKN